MAAERFRLAAGHVRYRSPPLSFFRSLPSSPSLPRTAFGMCRRESSTHCVNFWFVCENFPLHGRTPRCWVTSALCGLPHLSTGNAHTFPRKASGRGSDSEDSPSFPTVRRCHTGTNLSFDGEGLCRNSRRLHRTVPAAAGRDNGTKV